MSLPLTEAWKYQSFHVCGGLEGRLGGGEAVAVEWTPVLLFMLPSNFCTDCRKGEMISAWRFSSTACGD